MVCDAFVGDCFALFGVDVAVAFYGGGIIIKAKMRTCTKIAVEIFHLVAFFVLSVEGAELRLTLYHIFKSEIFYDFGTAQMT
jgi:hypothetical protein